LKNRISVRRIAVAAATTGAVTASALGLTALADTSATPAPDAAPAALTLLDPRFVPTDEPALDPLTRSEADAHKAALAAVAERKAEAARKARVAAERKAAAKRKAAAERAAAAQREAERRAQAEREAAEREAAERRDREREAAKERSSRSRARTPITGSGDARSIARSMVAARGWSSDQFGCLDDLWNRESGWRVTADNPSSSAYGIPQALPGSKMASAGSDWRTSARTQITWGLGYISDRYGTPCGALGAWHDQGWY
jgi:flagellar biosynthesis GTPase FlhF